MEEIERMEDELAGFVSLDVVGLVASGDRALIKESSRPE